MHPFSLSLQDTMRLKGIALVLLLWHHLFYEGTSQYNEWYIANIPVIQQTSLVAKCCVALFVFLSGYGLAIQAHKQQLGYIAFLRKRLKKLMVNYWAMWILFVPLGFCFLGLSLYEIYGNHAYVKLFINFLGFQDLFGFYGVNPTWWFYSLIILLYILFPLLNKLMNTFNKAAAMVMLSAVLVVLPHFTCTFALQLYLVSFVLGIFIACYCNKLIISMFTSTARMLQLVAYMQSCIFSALLLLIAIALVVLLRVRIPFVLSIGLDSVLSLLIVLLYKKTMGGTNTPFTRLLELVGRHSFNIFLFHTFIFYLYFPKIIYYPRNPILIFIWLLAICLAISVCIEWLKKVTGIAKI